MNEMIDLLISRLFLCSFGWGLVREFEDAPESLLDLGRAKRREQTIRQGRDGGTKGAFRDKEGDLGCDERPRKGEGECFTDFLCPFRCLFLLIFTQILRFVNHDQESENLRFWFVCEKGIQRKDNEPKNKPST